jgi:hypothetical protein
MFKICGGSNKLLVIDITFTKDFKLMFTVNWFNYDEPSYVIAYDPATYKSCPHSDIFLSFPKTQKAASRSPEAAFTLL